MIKQSFTLLNIPFLSMQIVQLLKKKASRYFLSHSIYLLVQSFCSFLVALPPKQKLRRGQTSWPSKGKGPTCPYLLLVCLAAPKDLTTWSNWLTRLTAAGFCHLALMAISMAQRWGDIPTYRIQFNQVTCIIFNLAAKLDDSWTQNRESDKKNISLLTN